MSKRERYQLDQPEVLQTLCHLIRGLNTPAAIIKATGNSKGAVSEKLNLLIRAHYVKVEDNEKDRRFKYFLPDYDGLQRSFVKLVKSRCEKRLREVGKNGGTEEELALLKNPNKFIQNTYAAFEKFNDSHQGKRLFKKLFELGIKQKDFIDSIDDVFEGIITVYSGLVKYVPKGLSRLTREQLEAVMACCIVARKLNLFALEAAAHDVLKEKD